MSKPQVGGGFGEFSGAGRSGGAGLVIPAVVAGFAAAVGVWIAWFFTHLPWLGLSEKVAMPVLLVVWVLGVAHFAARVPKKNSIVVGVIGGVICALVGLLALGTKLAAPAQDNVSPGLVPNAGVIVLGFLALGAALGGAAGVLGMVLHRGARFDGVNAKDRSWWLGQFAIVAAAAVLPLIFIGGLVTSTNSGMAVPDWPNTYGSNMFLYPLGPRARADVYLEHSHRLFGTMVGLTLIVLAVGTFMIEKRRWVWVMVGTALGLVIVQGVLGGTRVTQDSRWLAAGHGVVGQLVFGLVAACGVVLSGEWSGSVIGLDAARAKKLKSMSTALLHTLILQLILGAVYRQTRHEHVLYTHIVFSMAVLVIGLLCAFKFAAIKDRGWVLPTLGRFIAASLVVQWGLGWAAFLVAGSTPDPTSIPSSIVRTVHQANGALLLALAAAAFTLGRLAWRQASATAAATTEGAAAAPAHGR